MGMIDRFIGVSNTAKEIFTAATDVAEVFHENSTERMRLDEEAYRYAITQFGTEFSSPACGWFDRFVNGLNRLPRPLLTLGTLGLFGYAMTEPTGFAERMTGLQTVPEPLWWLLGAIVSFYFGAREAHHFRNRNFFIPGGTASRPVQPAPESRSDPAQSLPPDSFSDNAALRDWARGIMK